MLNKPLTGVKVVDLTYFVAGPGAGRMLADWGADVIKVEPSFGDPGRGTGRTMTCPANNGANPFYTTYNANKRCLSINLKSGEGKKIMDELLQSANVLLTSYRTEALKRLGLDYESLEERFPHLIWAQVIGFGTKGPARNNPGFDTVAFWARSGAMLDISERGSGPINPPIGFGDCSTSSSLAAGICAALYQQAKTGKGQKVLVSLYGQAIWNMSALVASCQYADEYPKTRKNAVSPVIDSFRCKDGKWIFLSILEHDRYYNVLVDQVFGRKDLVDDPRYATSIKGKENAAELIALLDEEFAKYTQDEIVEKLTSADIAHERIQHITDVLDDAQALENYYVSEWRNRDGSFAKIAATPVQFGAPTIVLEKAAPLVGQDSIEVLQELGYGDKDIEALISSGIVTVTEE